MKYSYQILLLILLCLSFALSAQDFDNYIPLRASGDLPEEFTRSSTERYEEERTSIHKGSQQKERKLQDKFYLESSFAIDQIFLSGRVLFNDPIGAYISKVADEILKNDPQLRAKLRFYVIKSMSSNAFTTQRGAIFVTMGMLARIENEAQLAFILSHEIAHFKEGHVLKSYVQKSIIQEEKDKGKGRYKKTNELEKIIQQSAYSQENERRADAIGLALYMKTDYNTAAVTEVFDVLLRDVNKPIMPLFSGFNHIFSSMLPATEWEEEVHKTDSVIEVRIGPKPSITIDSSKTAEVRYIIEGIDLSKRVDLSVPDLSVSAEEAKEAENTLNLSSHPDADERESLIRVKLPTKASGKLFLVSEEEYVSAVTMARFELSELLIENTAYYDAIYLILSMLGEYPESKFLKKCLLKAVYGYAQYYSVNGNLNQFFSYKSLPWPSRELEIFLEVRNKVELQLIALTAMWDFFQEDSTDLYCRKVLVDQVFDLLEKYPDFEKLPEDEERVGEALEKLMEYPEFITIYEESRDKRERADRWAAFMDSRKGKRYRKKYKKRTIHRGYRLGIDKLVIFNPSFYRLDVRKKGKNPIQFVAGEQQQTMIRNYLERAGLELGIDVTVLDSRSEQTSSQMKVFNDLSVLEAWQTEGFLHDEVDIVGSNYGEVQELIEKYGTPYFVNTGVISIRNRRDPSRFFQYILIVPFPISWPYVGYDAVRHNNFGVVYSLVYDMKEGKRLAMTYNGMRTKIKNQMLYDSLYFDLYQMKRKKSK